MKKVTKSKKEKKPQHENKAVEQEKKKASPLPKKMGSEIDEIFAGKKRKRPDEEKEDGNKKPAKVAAAKIRTADRKKGNSSKSRSFKLNSNSVRTSHSKKKTADGLPIFTEEELGIGKPDAGGTALCPFDCDCCF